VLAFLAALYGALVCLVIQRAFPRDVGDFYLFWVAGDAVLRGQSPYAAVTALGTPYPFFYPWPAALVMAPFALMPWRTAWIVWSALAGGLLGLAASRRPALWPILLSAGFLDAVGQGAWTPLLVAAAVLPWLSPALALKPSIGAALWLWRPTRLAAIGGLALLALSFILAPPGWLGEWRQSLTRAPHLPPILRPGGFLLLLAWLRWRAPEGRLVGSLALLPQTSGPYDMLPLFLLARTRLDGYLLAVLSLLSSMVAHFISRGATLPERAASEWPAMLLCLWLPALALALRAPSPEPLQVGEVRDPVASSTS
jgi:hypothetical protein